MDQTHNAKSSWKNQVRMAIEDTKDNATNFDELNELLKPQGVEIARTTEKTITYKHLAEDKKVRGNKLGHVYDKEEIIHGFDAEKRRREHENALENVLKQQDFLMRNLEKLENNESERNNRNEKLKNELKDSISTFN